MAEPSDRPDAAHHPDDNAFWPIVVGTIVWAVLGVALLVTPESRGADVWWWPLTCLVGVVCGVGGLLYLTWRDRRVAAIRSGRARRPRRSTR